MAVVKITEEAAARLRLLAQIARAKRSSEIAGLGLAKVEDGCALIYHLWPVLADKYSSAHVDLEKDDMSKELFRLHQLQEAARAGAEAAEAWHQHAYDHCYVWWHSHPPSGPNDFSGTDENTFKELNQTLKADWGIALLTNGQWIKASLKTWQPFVLQVATHEVEVVLPQQPELVAELEHAVETTLPEKAKEAWSRHGSYSKYSKDNNWEYEGYDWTRRDRHLPFGQLESSDGTSRHGLIPDGRLAEEWHRWCTHGHCTQTPLYRTRLGSQLCETHFKQLNAAITGGLMSQVIEVRGAAAEVDLGTTKLPRSVKKRLKKALKEKPQGGLA